MNCLPKGLAKGGEDAVGVGVCAPELGGDEEVVALGEASMDGLGHGLAQALLRAVERGGVKVAISEGDGLQYCRAEVFRGRWRVRRRPHADDGYGMAGA